MTTAELAKRLFALGCPPPSQVEILGDKAYYCDGDRDVELTDQHARDLLCADFERWLIGKDYHVSTSVQSDGTWAALVGAGDAESPDKLSALVEAAVAALTKEPADAE